MRPIASSLGLALAGLLLQAGVANASQYQVAPVQLVFTGAETTALLTVRNQDADALRFQVTVSAWSQSPDGEMLLAPTEDVQLFPRLLSVPPGGEAKIRISSRVPRGPVEKTYRLFIEELPPLERPDEPSGARLRVLTKTGVPIFISSTQPLTNGKIEGVAATDGILRFTVRNEGSAHFSVRSVRVRLLGAGDAELAVNTLNGWYVLAGGQRDYALTLPDDVCAGVRAVEVLADTTAGELRTREAVDCTGPTAVRENN